MLSIFSYACWPSAYLLWKNVPSGPLPIFFSFLMLSCMSCLHILDQLLVGYIDCKKFTYSHSVSCLFVLLMDSFTVKKLFSLM